MKQTKEEVLDILENATNEQCIEWITLGRKVVGADGAPITNDGEFIFRPLTAPEMKIVMDRIGQLRKEVGAADDNGVAEELEHRAKALLRIA